MTRACLLTSRPASTHACVFVCAQPSCVDFFLLGHLDWREPTFEKLRERFQVDPIAAFPKVSAIGAELRKAKGYKEFTAVRMMSPVKDEVLDAYNS